MDRRSFLGVLGLAFATPALAQSGPADRDRMAGRRWEEMDHQDRMRAMERMRGPRHEPRWEQMRERWDRMSPAQRRTMMERHDGSRMPRREPPGR